jgi:transposase
MLYVGIDVAKNKHDFAVLDDQATIVLKNKQFPNTRDGFALLHKTLQQFNETCLIALEDTGHYAFNLLAFLLDNNYQTYTYNPLLIKEFVRSTTLRKTKTDKKDALLIATKLVSDPQREHFRTRDNTQNELKVFSRHVSRLTKQQTQTKIQYTRLLDILFPELAHALKGKHNTHSQFVYQMLERFPSPEKIVQAGFEQLLDIPRLTAKHALAILNVAEQSIGTTSEAKEFELLQTIQQLYFLQAQLQVAKQKVDEVMERNPSVITTVKGIGNRFASVILAEIGNIHTFKNPAQLLAFAGLEPAIYQSGQSSTTGKLVKHGSPHLRWALIQAAASVARYVPVFKAYLRLKLLQGRHWNVALTHVAKKLVRVLFYMLKNNRIFDENKLI